MQTITQVPLRSRYQYHIYFTYREDINSYLSRNGTSTNDSIFACPADNFDCTESLVKDFFYPEPVSDRGFHHLKQTDYSSYILNGEAAQLTARV